MKERIEVTTQPSFGTQITQIIERERLPYTIIGGAMLEKLS